MIDDSDDGLPSFLKISAEERARTWKQFDAIGKPTIPQARARLLAVIERYAQQKRPRLLF